VPSTPGVVGFETLTALIEHGSPPSAQSVFVSRPRGVVGFETLTALIEHGSPPAARTVFVFRHRASPASRR